MRTIDEREIRQPVVIEETITQVECDRCGKSALCRNASADKGWFKRGPWGVVYGLIQGGDEYMADLCQDCTDELRLWIGSGSGKGAQQGWIGTAGFRRRTVDDGT